MADAATQDAIHPANLDSLSPKEQDFLIGLLKSLMKKDATSKIDYKSLVAESKSLTLKSAYQMAWKLKIRFATTAGDQGVGVGGDDNGLKVAGKKRGRKPKELNGGGKGGKRVKVDMQEDEEGLGEQDEEEAAASESAEQMCSDE